MNEPELLVARFGAFHVDEREARLMREGRPVDVAPKAFALLCALARQPGRLVTKDALLDRVWGHRHVSESVLKTTISQLRQALADDARDPRYIETAARRGYRFIAALDTSVDKAAASGEPVSGGAPLPRLIGRDATLALLQRRLAAASAGEHQLVWVAGEAGIGKTALIDRFAAGVLSHPVVQARGQCVEHYGAAEPYMPVLEALNLLCRGAGGPALVALMRQVAPTWLLQLPWFLDDDSRQRLRRETAGATADRMLREFGELLDRFTAERPLLLVLEDLHWSDHATVQLLGYLARRRGPAAWMVLGSFRPAEVIVEDHPLAGLRQELRLHRLCEEIDLEAFSEAEVDTLVTGRLGGQRAPEAFVRRLYAHTEGLPLFVVTLLDELIAEGVLRQEAGGWSFPQAASLNVPRDIVGVIEKQIARLPPAQQQWLSAASVAGAEFIHLPLAAALQVPPAELQGTFDAAAARQQWLRSAGVVALSDGRLAARYAFRHVLYRHVFYQRLGEVQRVQLHRQVAAALREAYGPLAAEVAAELAMHFERGGEPEQAMAQLAVVAGRAMGRSAAREALHAARQGLQLLGASPAPPELELDLRVLEGVALSRLHVISEPEVAAAFERARVLCERVGPSPALARALHGLWWVSFARGELAQARALAQRNLGLADASQDLSLRLAGNSAMGVTLAMLGELREAQRHLEVALETYAVTGDRLPPGMFVQDPGVEAMGYLAIVCWWRGEPARSRRLAAEAVALAARIRHPISQLVAFHLVAVVHYFAGEFEAARQAVERLVEVIRSHGLPSQPGAFGWLHGHMVAALGRVDEGFAEMLAAERSCRQLGMQIAMTGFHMHYSEACRDAGRSDDAMAAAARGLALAVSGHERFLLAPLRRIEGELLLARGDVGGAEKSLRAALTVAAEQGAGFHELTALVAAARLPAGSGPAWRERLEALLDDYRDEVIPVVQEARALLAGGIRPT